MQELKVVEASIEIDVEELDQVVALALGGMDRVVLQEVQDVDRVHPSFVRSVNSQEASVGRVVVFFGEVLPLHLEVALAAADLHKHFGKSGLSFHTQHLVLFALVKDYSPSDLILYDCPNKN